jgi:hypothetical protein
MIEIEQQLSGIQESVMMMVRRKNALLDERLRLRTAMNYGETIEYERLKKQAYESLRGLLKELDHQSAVRAKP